MSSETGAEYAFLCPACGESLEVNDSMKQALIQKGCIICGTTVTDGAFTRISSPDSP
ncbi:DUF7560 family zinc ribbon protein [Halococcus thailandensis]|uniref:Uncharacterized protein n=1 Tax=Halococcus thailandensis JCM 13552 TaxID=1227457 RepID=M0NDR6_9EURY|nr:hypothetical protein [Halococcus thailandensis]EMA56112.1 hypothetical protein C451_04089 [Halococcus thailandensis JCM 13552]